MLGRQHSRQGPRPSFPVTVGQGSVREPRVLARQGTADMTSPQSAIRLLKYLLATVYILRAAPHPSVPIIRTICGQNDKLFAELYPGMLLHCGCNLSQLHVYNPISAP